MPRYTALILLSLLTLLLNACAGGQTTQRLVVTEYLLTDAGFKKLDVNDTSPKRQALLEAVPRGKIVTYKRNGETYHVYADEPSQNIYIGDEAAYQRYLLKASGRQVCERVDATESEKFWSCFDDLKTGQR